MSKLHFRISILFAFVLTMSSLPGQTIVVSTQGNNLFEVDMNDCSYQQIGTVPMRTTDIGFHPNGNLYAVTSVGELFLVDYLSGNFTSIYTFEATPSQLFTALTIGGDGTFYACGDQGRLFIYDLDSNTGNFLGDVGFPAEGDLAFNNGELYMAATNDNVVRVNTTVPSASEIVISGDVPNRLFGLVSSARSCQNLRTYALTDQSAAVYEVDFINGVLRPYCDIPLAITGGASTFEFFGSAPVFIDSLQVNDFDCLDGDVTVFASGGIEPLEYSADGISFQSASSFMGIPGNTDSLFVRDAVGCEVGSPLEVDVDGPVLEVRNPVRATCGQANGGFEVYVYGGVEPYELSLDGQSVGSDTLFTGLEVGSYTLSVVDAQGCIFELPGVVVTGQSIPVIDQIRESDSRCGEDNGIIIMNVVGGTPPYMWQLNDGPLQANNTFFNVAPGMYTLRVVDAAGCQVEGTALVEALAAVELVVDSLTATTCGLDNGAFQLSAQGGAPFTYALDGGSLATDSVFTDLAAGEYRAVVQNVHNCTDTTFVKIGESEGIRFNPDPLIQAADCVEDNGRIQFDFFTDPLNYTLTLNGQAVVAGINTIENLAGGTYLLMASQQECLDTLSFRIPRKPCPIYFPNAFSPNRDGVNDYFTPQGLSGLNVEVSRFAIFDRWGGQVHLQGPLLLNDTGLRWDGTSRGKELPQGVYLYFAEVQYEDGETVTFSGEVVLVR